MNDWGIGLASLLTVAGALAAEVISWRYGHGMARVRQVDKTRRDGIHNG